MERIVMTDSLTYECAVKEALIEMRKELQEFGCLKCKGYKHINREINAALDRGAIKKPGDIRKVLRK